MKHHPAGSLVTCGILAAVALSWACAAPAPAETVWNAVEMNGKLIGHARTDLYPAEAEQKKDAKTHTDLLLKLTVLGQPFDVRMTVDRKTDFASGAVKEIVLDIVRGEDTQKNRFAFSPGKVTITSLPDGQERTLDLPEGVLVEDDLDYSRQLADVEGSKSGSKMYRVLELTRGEIHEKTYTDAGRESLDLAGAKYDCRVLDVLDRTFGIKGKVWVDRNSGRVVRVEASNGFVSYLADASVRDRVARGDMDSMIFGKVNVAIPDFHEIEYMKVRATLRTAGEWVSPESLNVPGQKFTGTVDENLVNGVFEISWPRYGGEDAPPFPPSFGTRDDLAKYLSPENMVESDDDDVRAKAEEIAKGAKDSWEAAGKLSRWVADEIGYSIPGGSARHTLETRKGECGSHARLLTAFCRSVGIPARIVSGGLYTPIQGGSFGQHAWTEVYMGKAGWVPVDPTVKESDYVDSGHLRLGELVTFNPSAMEVLDYRAGSRKMGEEPEALARPGRLPWEVGRDYHFRYRAGGRDLGTETLTIEKVEANGSIRGKSRLDLGVLEAEGTWSLAADGSPTSFQIAGKASGTSYSIHCTFQNGKVEETVDQGGQNVDKTIELPAGVRLLDNNNLGLMSLILADAPRKEGETRALKVFHPSSMQVLSAELTAGPMETIEWNGGKVQARRVEMSLAGTSLVFWLDGEGRMLRNTQQGGAVLIDWEPAAP